MSNVKWIKIVVDIFDDEKILLIESMPDSDSIIVIWFKLLALAGKINNGGVLMINEQLAYTDEMLATIFRRKLTTVKLALKTFEALGMILIINNAITIPNWSKHQSLQQLEKRKKYMREYMQKYRKEQLAMAHGQVEKEVKQATGEESSRKCKTNGKANSKTNVSSLEGEKEREREEVDKDIYRKIVDYLNIQASKAYKATTKTTQNLIAARIKEGFKLDDFKRVIDTKVQAWKGDTKMEAYLRPSTLFGSKFESYLNEKNIKPSQTTEEYGW